MTRYSTEPRTRKYVEGYEFLSFARKYKKQLLGTGLNASKKVVHKVAEFFGKKVADALTKSVCNNIVTPDENSKNVEEIIISLGKKY